MNEGSQPDFRAVFAHLCRVHQDRLFVVGALPLGGGPTECHTYNHTAESAFIEFAQRNPDRDMCQVMNEPSKPIDGWSGRKEAAFKNVWHLVIDFDVLANVDRAAAQERILAVLMTDRPTGVPAPTWIERANGIKAYWSLRDPIYVNGNAEAIEDAKLYGVGLEDAFKPNLTGIAKVDSCRSIDHLFRVAGVVCRKPNQPDAPVVIVDDHIGDPAFMYGLDQLPKAAKDEQQAPGDGAPNDISDDESKWKRYAALTDIPVSDRIRAVMNTLTDPLEPTKYPSRSEAQIGCTCAMVRAGMTDDEIAGVLSDRRFKVSEEIFLTSGGAKRPNWKKYLHRQIERARASVKTEDRAARNNGDGWVTNEDARIIAENQHNMRLAISKLGVVVKYNVFANRMLIVRDGKTEILNDARTSDLWFEIDRTFIFRPGYQLFDRFTSNEAWRNSFHPVRDYLNGLTWDGTPRLDGWLTTYGKADDTDFNRAVGRIVLIAAVRRIRHPGVKFDEMLILESAAQGKNKSTALKVLAVRDEWFNDTLPLSNDVNRKVEAMQGRWLVEAGELSGMSEAGVAKLKNFLSSQTDCTRLAWEKKPDEYPRQCVIIGTTNESVYLKDDTGNRRYWPVRIGEFDIAALSRDRDQLWAEAAHAEAQGETIRLDPTLYNVAAEQQEQRREVTPIEEKLMPLFGPGKADGKFLTDKVWEVLGLNAECDLEKRQRLSREVGKAMRAMGWARKLMSDGGERRYYYVRGEDQRELFADGD